MPKLLENVDLEEFETGHFGYSATSVDELKKLASKFTLATLVIDASGSTEDFTDWIEKATANSIKALQDHPLADQILLRIVVFRTTHQEISGFASIHSYEPDQFEGTLHASGATACFDATIDAVEGTFNFSKTLKNNKLLNNGIVIVITDGVNNQGRYRNAISDIPAVKKAFDSGTQSEQLESLTTILIAVNYTDAVKVSSWESDEASGMTVKDVLTKFHEGAGFSTNLIGVEKADPGAISRIGRFVTSSVSSTSQACGTGGPSQEIPESIEI